MRHSRGNTSLCVSHLLAAIITGYFTPCEIRFPCVHILQVTPSSRMRTCLQPHLTILMPAGLRTRHWTDARGHTCRRKALGADVFAQMLTMQDCTEAVLSRVGGLVKWQVCLRVK